MPFNNIPFNGNSTFTNAEFTKSEGDRSVKACNLFPKNAAGQALRKIEIANALMVTFEQTILLGPRAVLMFATEDTTRMVEEMAEARCEIMESLGRLFCGERVRGRCLVEGDPMPGFRFVNCEDEPPPRPQFGDPDFDINEFL